MGNPQNIQNLISSIGPVGAEEILSLDPTDKHQGFRELESWVDGSLDMYRVSQSPAKYGVLFTFVYSPSLGPSCFPYSAISTLTWYNKVSEKLVRIIRYCALAQLTVCIN